MTYSLLAGAGLWLVLFIATITDIRHRTIPIVLCLTFAVFIIILHITFAHSFLCLICHALAGGLLFGLFLINALFFRGGGGDCILAFCIGLALGLTAGLFITILSCVSMVLYHLLTRRKKTHYPVAPSMLLAATIYFILSGGPL